MGNYREGCSMGLDMDHNPEMNISRNIAVDVHQVSYRDRWIV